MLLAARRQTHKNIAFVFGFEGVLIWEVKMLWVRIIMGVTLVALGYCSVVCFFNVWLNIGLGYKASFCVRGKKYENKVLTASVLGCLENKNFHFIEKLNTYFFRLIFQVNYVSSLLH
jgi:hypothetical protein